MIRRNEAGTELRARFPAGILAIVLIAAAVFAVYAQALQFGFLDGDDQRHILDNRYLHDLTLDNLLWIFASAEIDYWRPLSFLTHAIDFALWGENGSGHHLTSLVLHTVNALLVMAIARFVLTRGGANSLAAAVGAGLAGLLFAVHPQNVETAAWLAERKGVLVATFYLATVWAYLRGQGTDPRWRALAVGFALLAMMSKPLAVSLPFALLMLDIYPLRRLQFRDGWRVWLRVGFDKLPYILLAIGVSLYTYLAVRTGGYLNNTEVLTTTERLINAARSVWVYLGRWFYPLELAPLYPLEVLDNSMKPANLVAPVALLATGVAAVFFWVRGNGVLLCLAGMHLLLIGPALGLVHVGIQSSADRYAYLPDAWVSVTVATLVVFGWQRARALPAVRGALVVLPLAALFGFAIVAQQQVRVWESKSAHNALLKHQFPDWRANAFFQDGLDAYLDKDYGRAAAYFQAAIDHKQLLPRSHMFLAMALQRLGQQAIGRDHVVEALRRKPRSLLLWQLAAEFYAAAGQYDDARNSLIRLDELAPRNRDTARRRAAIEVSAGEYDAARRLLEPLLTDEDVDGSAHVLYGIAAHRAGDLEAARAAYEAALARDPDNADAAHNLRTLERLQ
ncbi:MAG: tetratricopeptide repeat protein [Pseudomonadota bacterium]